MSILTDLKDPRVSGATITKVEVTPDMRQAKVYFMTRGGETKEQLVLKGLRSAAGFLQQKCAKRIDTRYTPTLVFAVDEGVKNLIAVTQILADERAKRDEDEPVDEIESDDEENFEEEEESEEDA